MRVEVAYAKPLEQWILPVDIAEGAKVADAISASGILERFPEIDLATATVGIFGKPCALEHLPRAGDRIEIYRPLAADPRVARRERLQRER